MIRMILLCNAGLSSSFVVDRIKKEFQAANIDTEITSSSFASLKTAIDVVDIVLIAPQLRFMEKEVGEFCDKFNKPYLVIDAGFYGMAEGSEIVNKILSLVGDDS